MGEGDGGLPSLADTIAAVGRELGSAQAAGVGQRVQFRTGPVGAEGLEAHEADDELANNGPSFRFGSILVITYGRSGSTLLQGILNSIDGILIRGENHNFLLRSLLVLQKLAPDDRQTLDRR